jgi:mono/diheme cytochrome c family protein
MKLGKEVYSRATACVTCHQPDGKGLPGVFPPLAGSEWIDDDVERQIKIAVWGLMGEIEVAGETYVNAMVGQGMLLTDEEIAAVLTYVRNSFGHQGGPTSTEDVTRVKESLKDRPLVQPWTVEEILADHPLTK